MYKIIENKSPEEIVNKSTLRKFESLSSSVKVAVIDGFKENQLLECSTFHHPKLDDKITVSSKLRKLEADDHAAHVCGIISDMTDESTIFDIFCLNNDLFEIKFTEKTIVNMSIVSETLNTENETYNFVINNLDTCIFIISLGNTSKSYDDQDYLRFKNLDLIKHKVIFVGNIASDGKTLSPSSTIPGQNKDMQEMTVFAPGHQINSTVPILTEEEFEKQYPDQQYNDTGFAEMTGTSMAAPLVANLTQQFPSLSQQEIVQIVRGSCTQIAEPELVGNGLINYNNLSSI